MSFITKSIMPILEQALLDATPDIAAYLLRNSKTIGDDFVTFLQEKIKSAEKYKAEQHD